MKKKLRVVFILPTYNEAGSISLVIEQLQNVFASISSYTFLILVVDDKSPDNTAGIVEKLRKKYSNIDLITGEKQGLGIAYIRGMKYAESKLHADIFFSMDSDLSHDPSLIPQFLQKIKQGSDIVVGARYIPGGSIPADWAWQRKVFSIAGNLIIRFGLMIPSIHDWSSGYRAIKVEVFRSIMDGLDKYKGYTFQMAYLHRALNARYKVGEVPLNFVDRRHGESKFIPFEYISNVLLYILLNSSFIKFGVVGIIGFTVNLIGLEVFYQLGFHPGIAAAFGAEFAIISNFTLNNFWSFSHKSVKRGDGLRLKFLRFNGVAVGAILIQALIVGMGTNMFGADRRFLFLLLSLILIVPYSYVMYNRIIWKDK